MRILALVAAAAVATFAVPAASAAPAAPAAPAAGPATADQVRVVVTDRDRRYYQRHHRRHHRAYWRRNCTTKWRHGHRIRVCRRVRYWR